MYLKLEADEPFLPKAATGPPPPPLPPPGTQVFNKPSKAACDWGHLVCGLAAQEERENWIPPTILKKAYIYITNICGRGVFFLFFLLFFVQSRYIYVHTYVSVRIRTNSLPLMYSTYSVRIIGSCNRQDYSSEKKDYLVFFVYT